MRTSSTGRPAAFTLIELLVVVVVITVLATMIGARLWGAGGSAQLRESARRLLVTAMYARDFAASRRCNCRLVIDRAEGRYALAYEQDGDGRPGEFVPLRGGAGKSDSLGRGLRFEKVLIDERPGGRPGERADYVTFTPAARCDAAVVQITDGRRTYSMLIEGQTARASLVEGRVDELPDDRVDLDG